MRTSLYLRLPRLIEALTIARGDGRYARFLAEHTKADVLLLRDRGLAALSDSALLDLLELLDDRHGMRSTIVTSQLPLAYWHDAIGDSTLADAILERQVHDAHQLTLPGEPMRKKRNSLTKPSSQQ